MKKQKKNSISRKTTANELNWSASQKSIKHTGKNPAFTSRTNTRWLKGFHMIFQAFLKLEGLKIFKQSQI